MNVEHFFTFVKTRHRNSAVLANITERGISLGAWVQGLGIAVDDSGVNKMKVIT